MWTAGLIALGVLLLLSLELLPMDQVGLLALLAVVLAGLVEPGQALGFFGHPAVITIGSLLVMAQGLHRTGALAWLVRFLAARSSGRMTPLLFWMCLVTALASAFVNNTPTVAVFLPVVLGLAGRFHVPPSKLLIPLSYASILGGTCTLLGTSTNILVSEVTARHGFPPIGIFEILPVGAAFTALGLAYLLLFGKKLLPERPSLGVPREGEKTREFVTEVGIHQGSSMAGRPVEDLERMLQARVLVLIRGEEMLWPPPLKEKMREGDILLIKGSVNSIAGLDRLQGVELLPELMEGKVAFDPRTMTFVELLVPPGSPVVGRQVRELRLHRRAGLVVAVMRKGRHLREKVSRLILQPGDVLLAFGDARSIAEARQMEEFVLTEDVQERVVNKRKAPLAVLILAGMVGAIALGVLPAAVAALAGATAMVLGGCLNTAQAYKAVDWRILFLLVGALALGRSLEVSGLAERLAHTLVENTGGRPLLVVAGLYLASVVLTELFTHGAVAVLMTPVALTAAAGLGLEHRPFIMAVLFACSASFLTPVGFQTNTLVYGIGGYKFRDFFLVGLPLQGLCFLLTMGLVPLVWPFRPL